MNRLELQRVSGILPPQSIDIEKAALGAMMLEREGVYIGMSELKEECFYKDDHKAIFNAISSLHIRGEKIDILTVTHELRRKGDLTLAGGPAYVSELTQRVNSSANLEYHCAILKEQMFRRMLIQQSSEIEQKAYDPTEDVFDLMDKGYKGFNHINEIIQKKKITSISGAIDENLRMMDERFMNPTEVTGISTGYKSLDNATGGFYPTNLIIIAARPGMGKTSFMMESAKHAAIDLGLPVAVFSIEMSIGELTLRMQSSLCEIDSREIKRGAITKEQRDYIREQSQILKTDKLIIDDTSNLKLYELKARCNLLKNKHDIQAVYIDYLTLIDNGSATGNKHQEVGQITKTLKGIAKELNIPVICLSQLSRAVEQRGGDKRPQLSDLRESGSIEEDADMVMFLYRPDYYGILEDGNGNSLKGICQVDIAKYRHGAVDKIPLKFIPQYTKFRDLNIYDHAKF